MTNEQKLLNVLNQAGGPLCDDCVAIAARFSQRQTANSICRNLDNRGQIKRVRGKCFACSKFKIVNESMKGKHSEIQTEIPKSKEIDSAYPPWYWEGNVQSVLVNWLVSRGYRIRVVADTIARSQGKDIIAVDPDGIELWVTVKGYPEKSSNVQARHWFSDALMSLALYRNENSSVKLGLALPDGFSTYLNLASRIEWLRRKMPVSFYWISEDGKIRVE